MKGIEMYKYLVKIKEKNNGHWFPNEKNKGNAIKLKNIEFYCIVPEPHVNLVTDIIENKKVFISRQGGIEIVNGGCNVLSQNNVLETELGCRIDKVVSGINDSINNGEQFDCEAYGQLLTCENESMINTSFIFSINFIYEQDWETEYRVIEYSME